MQKQYPKRHRLSLVLSLALAFVLGMGWFYRQDIADWYRVRNYQASAEVLALADQTTMTDYGRRIFYSSHPEISDKTSFNNNCRQGSVSEYSIVLGCYISRNGLYGNLYLYDIDDQRLEGIKQVTAAHEMLHAAYDRLSQSEKQEIDRQLMEVYNNLPDGRIKDTIGQYEANDPSSVPSELHSILGTELADLPQSLEKYYSKYFTNRQAIVAYSLQYDEEFTRRESQVATYDRQLSELKATIEADQAEIDSLGNLLRSQRNQLDQYEANGNAVGFNNLVGEYNANVDTYNTLVRRTRDEIDNYNGLVEIRNDLALEVKELSEAIDSRPQTL